MINNLNEIIIFFLIIIIIILSYYDIKYTIIFIIIAYLFYIYFNKITFKEEVNYKKYDDNINITLKKLEKYKYFDYDSYRLGLKYYKYFIRNIKIINDTFNNNILKSYLENSKIYLETSIFHFNAILFSIDIDNMNYINDINVIIKDLEKYGNILIGHTEHQYNKNIKCDDIKQDKYNIFCDNDPLINKFTNAKPELYESPIYDKSIFNDNNNITTFHNMIKNDPNVYSISKPSKGVIGPHKESDRAPTTSPSPASMLNKVMSDFPYTLSLIRSFNPPSSLTIR